MHPAEAVLQYPEVHELPVLRSQEEDLLNLHALACGEATTASSVGAMKGTGSQSIAYAQRSPAWVLFAQRFVSRARLNGRTMRNKKASRKGPTSTAATSSAPMNSDR